MTPAPEPERSSPTSTTADLAHLARRSTPARVFLGSAGVALPTRAALRLRADHAAARDAVAARFDEHSDALAPLDAIPASSCASTPAEHLLRPDLGRRLDPGSAATLREHGSRGVDVQFVVGDGLSAGAVEDDAAPVVTALQRRLAQRGLVTGRPILVRHCRVGIMNDIGDILDPEIVVLLIGERPGLATHRSMSAYLAHRPRSGDTDADRNCISNIHRDGVSTEAAVERIDALLTEMRRVGASGVTVKEPDPNLPEVGPPQVR